MSEESKLSVVLENLRETCVTINANMTACRIDEVIPIARAQEEVIKAARALSSAESEDAFWLKEGDLEMALRRLDEATK